MTKWFVALLALLLATCAPRDSGPVGGRDIGVSIADCLEPQHGWISAEVTSFGWHIAPVGEVTSFGWHIAPVGEVTIRCGDTGLAGGSEEYQLGSNEVLFDPTKVHGSFEGQAAPGHGLIHWRIWHGPHPERGRYHVCDWPYNDPAPTNCYPFARAANALMSPSLGGTPSEDWSSESYTGSLAQYEITDVDAEFIRWALTP